MVLTVKKDRKYKWMIVGALLSLIGPAGWYVFAGYFPDSIVPKDVHPYIYSELLTLFSFSFFGLLFGMCADRTEKARVRDGVSGAYSRNHVLLKLHELMQLNRRHGKNFSLIVFDLDKFSQVNQKYGLLTGDRLLATFAGLVKKKSSKTDIFGRVEKDLFLLICPDSERKEAEKKAKTIGTALTKISEKALGFPGGQTVSAGVYELPPGLRMSIEELLKYLQKPLADAKVQGGNKIVVVQKSEETVS